MCGTKSQQLSLVGGSIIALCLITYWIAFHFVLKAPFYVHYDPEMAYLIASLSALKGHFIYYYDQPPGTPLEILGTFAFFFSENSL